VDETTMSENYPVRACWMKRGQQKQLPASGGVQRFYHLFGAYNWRSDTLAYTHADKKNSETFIQFLEHVLVDTYPHQTLVLVMDNVSYYRSLAVQAALSAFEHRLVVFYLPVYSPDLNLIERFWRHLKDRVCANRFFNHIQHLLDAIARVIQLQNDPLHPFRLTFLKDFQ
jgi:transposase